MLRVEHLPIAAKDLQAAAYVSLGPGGAGNVAIMARRLGLAATCLGEIGNDLFGDLLLSGLRLESVGTDAIVRSAEGKTPVAAVLVDASAEPAYVGYAGAQRLASAPEPWYANVTSRKRISRAGSPAAGRAPDDSAPAGAIAPSSLSTAATGAADPSSAQFSPPNAIIDVPTTQLA